MIRVNLIGVREPSTGVFEAGAPAAPSEKKGLLVAVVFLGVALAFIGWQYFNAQRTIGNLDEEIQQLTQEKARLQAIIQRVNEYQQKLLELEKREKLIERLKREREGPVRMLDDLSAQLPDFVWLTSLNQGANNVTIQGMASSYVSIADYIQKLEESEWFANVELIDARQGKEEFTSFQLQAQLTTPGGGAEAPPGGTPPGGTTGTR
jgi:Tfp pilus assembly protein PilN